MRCSLQREEIGASGEGGGRGERKWPGHADEGGEDCVSISLIWEGGVRSND